MKCLSPIPIRTGKYSRSFVDVPCGKCPHCRSLVRMDWFYRLRFEQECSRFSYWCTLTYDDQNLPTYGLCTDDGEIIEEVPALSKFHLQAFFKKFKKIVDPFKIRYFAVGEYGSHTYRPHYHALVFSTAPLSHEQICEAWPYGHSQITETPSPAQINYCAMDVLGQLSDDALRMLTDLSIPKPFRIMSRNPGIGFSYVHDPDFIAYHRDNLNTSNYLDGIRYRLPRYMKDRMLTDIQLKAIAKVNAERQSIEDERFEKLNPDTPEKFRKFIGEYNRICMLYERKLKTRM